MCVSSTKMVFMSIYIVVTGWHTHPSVQAKHPLPSFTSLEGEYSCFRILWRSQDLEILASFEVVRHFVFGDGMWKVIQTC